jgi:short-subunit dehydrogenase
MDETHQQAMRPEDAAPRIIDAVAKNKAEIRVGGAETLAVLMRRFFPRLIARITRMK